jgi:outer membrane protein TolC
VRLARLSYDAGSRTNTDVLDAELDLFRTRAGVVQSQLSAAEALINLELAFGSSLSQGAHAP